MGIRNPNNVQPAFTKDEAGNPTGGITYLPGAVITWQNGIIDPQLGQNGAFVEDVLLAAKQRLEFFNETEFRCRENSLAITKIEEALHWLDHRTTNRLAQGVENTYLQHK